MICKKLSVVALSGLTAALSLSAMAQDTTSSTTGSTGMMTGTMSGDTSMSGTGGMSGSASMSMQPTQVTGTVVRYYTDRSGYVTAMDVQTAEGVRMVRFAPGMAQRLYGTYPVGGQITGTVMPSMSMGMQRYDLIGLGEQMPAAGMMQPYMVSDVEMLRAEPFIQSGTRMLQFKGKLNSVITDDMGEVLGLVLSGVNMPGMMGGTGMMNTSMSTGGMTGGASDASTSSSTASSTSTDATGATTTTTVTDTTTVINAGATSGGMMGGMMSDRVLVRVPREMRHLSGAQMAGSERVTPLFKGADVEVVGYPEWSRYGVVSAYGQRVAANALVVNGRAVGAVGVPRMMKGSGSTLLPLDIGGTTRSAEETNAMGMGYSTYGPSSGLTGESSMGTGTTDTMGGGGGM